MIPGHRQDPEADLLDLQPGDNGEQITNRSGQSVELGDGEAVAIAHIVEGGLKLLAFGNRGDLFLENPVTAGGPKLALLGFQAGELAD